MWHGNFQVQIYLSICFYWNLLLTCFCFILFLVFFILLLLLLLILEIICVCIEVWPAHICRCAYLYAHEGYSMINYFIHSSIPIVLVQGL